MMTRYMETKTTYKVGMVTDIKFKSIDSLVNIYNIERSQPAN